VLPAAPKAVLVLKPCCLGDVLIATTVVGQLRQRYPAAKIAFAVGPWSKAAIEHHPDVDELVDCGRVGNGGRFGWTDYWALTRRLKQGGYEIAYVLDRSPLLTFLPFLAGIPHRVGIDSAGRGFSLTIKVPWNAMKHESELYLDTLRVSGWEPQEPRTRFVPSPEDRYWARQHLPLASSNARPDRRLVAVLPGGGVNPGMTMVSKRWFPERFAALIERLLAHGHTVVLVGAPSDIPVNLSVMAALPEPCRPSKDLIDLTAATSFGQLGAVIECCHLFVGNDSGPTHLAVAVGTPTVAIFGPTSPSMYGPGQGLGKVVYKPVACSPCFIKGRCARDCQDFRCLQAITVDDVWLEVEQILGVEQRRVDAVPTSGTPGFP